MWTQSLEYDENAEEREPTESAASSRPSTIIDDEVEQRSVRSDFNNFENEIMNNLQPISEIQTELGLANAKSNIDLIIKIQSNISQNVKKSQTVKEVKEELNFCKDYISLTKM